MNATETTGMTARQRNQARANGTLVEPPKPTKAPPVPDVLCIHRSWSVVGKIRCNCANQPEVYTCECKFVPSGYATPRLPHQPGEGPINLPDGTKIVPADSRYLSFLPMPLKEGEKPRPCDVVVCSSCPYRVEPPPHIARLMTLGIQGNFDPDTGHADIVHVAPEAPHWQQHMRDHCASAPDGLRACWMTNKAMPDLESIQSATGCRMMVLNCYLGKPEAVEKAAKALPEVKFVVVYHGSQNYMVTQGDWSRLQRVFLEFSRNLPNVWYGTPEPTAPWTALGYERFLIWPNTMPFPDTETPLPDVDPPRLLIAGRRCITKAHPAALLAAALIAKQRPVRIAAVVKDLGTGYKDLATAAGVEVEYPLWRSQVEFRKWVGLNVSVTLQGSLTDSFNYLGLDSLSQGRPVVGSQTIRYLPREWQADPNDPADIARVALMFLDDYARYSAEALKLGCEIRDRQRDAYHAAVARILE